MKILLTNDDGYNAQGITILRDLLSKYAEVTIVAPFEHMSGKSASITLGEWLKVDKIDEHTYAVHGTPTDSANLGLGGLDIDFDLVVSGCNSGHNLSYDVFLSGTIGACMGATIFRKKTIAFSGPFDDYSNLIEHFDEIWEFINKYNLPSEEYCLNINIPKGEVKGIKIGRCYFRQDHYYFDKKDDTFYPLRDVQSHEDMPEWADYRQVKEGYISIVPISRLPFSEEQYQEVLKKVQGK